MTDFMKEAILIPNNLEGPWHVPKGPSVPQKLKKELKFIKDHCLFLLK